MKFRAKAGAITFSGYSSTHTGYSVRTPVQSETRRLAFGFGSESALKNLRFCFAVETAAVVTDGDSHHRLVVDDFVDGSERNFPFRRFTAFDGLVSIQDQVAHYLQQTDSMCTNF